MSPNGERKLPIILSGKAADIVEALAEDNDLTINEVANRAVKLQSLVSNILGHDMRIWYGKDLNSTVMEIVLVLKAKRVQK
jgi:hypothetical protein